MGGLTKLSAMSHFYFGWYIFFRWGMSFLGGTKLAEKTIREYDMERIIYSPNITSKELLVSQNLSNYMM